MDTRAPGFPATRDGAEPQHLTLAGATYVVLAKADYERLCSEAQRARENASRFGIKSIGPDLRDRRLRARLKATDVARSAGIRVETLSRIENGRTNPTVATVQSILAALDRTARGAAVPTRSASMEPVHFVHEAPPGHATPKV
jgi:DNA-binding XRE family transcriptional regulator